MFHANVKDLSVIECGIKYTGADDYENALPWVEMTVLKRGARRKLELHCKVQKLSTTGKSDSIKVSLQIAASCSSHRANVSADGDISLSDELCPEMSAPISQWSIKIDPSTIQITSMHIIDPMFKAWLRELPSEILPKAVQDETATERRGMASRNTFRDPPRSCPRQDCYWGPMFLHGDCWEVRAFESRELARPRNRTRMF